MFSLTGLTLSGERLAERILHHPKLLLTLICLILWLPGIFSLPPLDRDESRFAQASKQMVETGNLVDIRFGEVPRYKKPVGIYWAQAATTVVADLAHTGPHNRIWTYRIPSLIGAIFAVLLTYWVAEGIAGSMTGVFAGMLMAMSLLLTAEASIATTDAAQLATIVAAQGVFLRIYRASREGKPTPGTGFALLGWAALGIGTLIKGPVAIAVVAITLVALALWDGGFRRLSAPWLKDMHWHRGLVIVLLIVAPWAVAIGVQSHGNFYSQALGHDFAGKIAGGQESHGAPFGYYLALLPLCFWPGTLFLLQGFGEAVRRFREPAVRYLIAWSIPGWLMFAVVPTKLPHYILAVYPALAMLAALWITGKKPMEKRVCRILAQISPVLYVLIAIAFIAATFILPHIYGPGAPKWLPVTTVLFLGLTVAVIVSYSRREMKTCMLMLALSLFAMYPVLTAWVGPRLSDLWISPRAAATIATLSRPGDPPVKLAGYTEPSMVFLLGTDTRLGGSIDMADISAKEGGLAMIDAKHTPSFLAEIAAQEAGAVKVGEVDGYKYSKGKRVQIFIWRITPVHDITTGIGQARVTSRKS